MAEVMESQVKYSMIISKGKQSTFNIKLMNSSIKPECELLEFESDSIPSIEEVIKKHFDQMEHIKNKN